MLNFAQPKLIQLRPYQADAVEGLRAGIRSGLKRQILVAPTGAGKTVIGSHLLQQALEDMRRDGIRRVGLWVLVNNRRAERFYLSQGFHYDGQLQSQPLGPGTYQQRHMLKVL